MADFSKLRKVINVDKPVFHLSDDPNSNIQYKLNQQPSNPLPQLQQQDESSPTSDTSSMSDMKQQAEQKALQVLGGDRTTTSQDAQPFIQKQPNVVGKRQDGTPIYQGYEDLKGPTTKETIDNISDEIDHSENPKTAFYNILRDGDLSSEEMEALIHKYTQR